MKLMERYGRSICQAAALVLPRRLLGCSERIPRRQVCPVGNDVRVVFTEPALHPTCRVLGEPRVDGKF